MAAPSTRQATGILAEFASVVNAVVCAVAIQKLMAQRNAPIDPERRMQFRIGINLGDVIHDEQRVYLAPAPTISTVLGLNIELRHS